MPAHVDISGIEAVLAPYGKGERWATTAGPFRGAIASYGDVPDGQRLIAVAPQVDPTIGCCADAHLYNRIELRHLLGLNSNAGHNELICAAYQRWGDAFVDHIAGPFAVAIVDARRQGVLLARDH